MISAHQVNEFRVVGPHLVRVEPPDIVFVRFSGDVLREHFVRFYEAMAEIPLPTPIYLLRDAHHGGFVTRDARKHISQQYGFGRLAAVVTFGASFHAQTVMNMITRATRHLHTGEPETVFFEDEASARGWIDKHRADVRRSNFASSAE